MTTPAIKQVPGFAHLFVRLLDAADFEELQKIRDAHFLPAQCTEKDWAESRKAWREALIERAAVDVDGKPCPPPSHDIERFAIYLHARAVNGFEKGMDGEIAEFLSDSDYLMQWADLAWHFREPDVFKLIAKIGADGLLFWSGYRLAKALDKQEVTL